MRASITRRVDALEGRYRPVDMASLPDDDRRWFHGLCVSPFQETAWQFATILAERRHWHNAGVVSPWAGDWRETVPEPDRNAATQAELNRYLELPAMSPDEAVNQWTDVADQEGWPALGGIMFTLDASGFAAMEARRRHALDTSRGCEMPGAVAWRSRFPQWRPGMAGDDALAFDAMVLQTVDALEVA